MKISTWCISVYALLFLNVALLNACRPVKNMMRPVPTWSGEKYSGSEPISFDASKKTVFIVADYKLTELFDMMAPYYLFNATEKANVYIVAKEKTPVLVKRDLFVCPQLTFDQIDSLELHADVIVIPALSVRNNMQDSTLIAWIRKQHTPATRILAVCDGASTAAATGLYDGKLLTCHASDFAGISAYFNGPRWVQNVSVTKSDNLYSTAGVSNAAEGSLAVIEGLFGRESLQKVMNDIHYPYNEIKIDHRSIGVNSRNKRTAFKKIFFRRNRNVGILLENDVNEFNLASILDTYGRTFPASLNTYTLKDSVVHTKYGLTLINAGNISPNKLHEIHVLDPDSFSTEDVSLFGNATIIRYDDLKQHYPIDVCLKRIAALYGLSFEELVKVSLDYN